MSGKAGELVDRVGAAIGSVLADWKPEPLPKLAYDDMARAAISEINKSKDTP